MGRGVVSNERLAPLPDDLAVMRAVATVEEEAKGLYRGLGVRAQAIARQLDIAPARRLGRGAVQGSWSGYMAPALRISPRLLALKKRGLLGTFYGERSVRLYYLTTFGREFIEEGKVSDQEYVMEAADPIGDHPTDWKVGDQVTIEEDVESYGGETGKVLGVGVGIGMYAGNIVYDVLVEGEEEPWRFAESQLC